MKNMKWRMVQLQIKFPNFSQLIEPFGLKLEKGKKPKFVKPHTFAIIFYVALILNFMLVNYWFNGALQKKVPYMYNSLLRMSSIKTFGWLALIGKKATSGKMLVAVTSLPVIKQAIKGAFQKAFFLNAVVLVVVFLATSKKKNTTEGTARWGGLKDVDYQKGNDKFFGSSLLMPKGVVLGRLKGVTLRDDNKTHICVVAPTRTGKGVSIIIPTLIDSWNDGVLVLDIKGENYQLTSGARKEKFDNLILRFAPKSENSCKYNALSEVRLMSPQETEDVKLIADIICGVADAKGDAKYWVESASGLIFAIAFYVLYRNFLQRPRYIYENGVKKPVSDASMIDVINFMTDPNETDDMQTRLKRIAQEENMVEKFGVDEETKAYVRQKLHELYGGGVDKETVERGNHPKASRGFVKNGTLADQTFASVMGQATTNLQVFDMSTVAKNTSASDFRIYDLMNWKRPVSLYLVIPPADIIVLAPLIKMLILQIVNLLTPEIDYTNQKGHKWRMLMLLDEFPAIGKMEALETGIGYFAGYGMKMMIVLQSLDQLFKIYGDKNGFLSNCQAQIFYTANDKTTANYVSELLGKETIQQFTQSNKSVGTLTKSLSESFKGRSLLMPDEVMRFPSDKIIVKLSGRNPVKSDKIVYFQEPEYSRLVKIPYIYSESCYDETRQYIKLTPEQKKKFKDYPYNYVPYPEALKVMKDDIEAKRNAISAISKEQENAMDKVDRDRHEMDKANLKKQINGFKVYVKIFNALAKEDERIAQIMKKLAKEVAQEKASKVAQRSDNADRIVIEKKNISIEDTFEEIKKNSVSVTDTGFISDVKIENPNSNTEISEKGDNKNKDIENQDKANIETEEKDVKETLYSENELNSENDTVDDSIDEEISETSKEDDDIFKELDAIGTDASEPFGVKGYEDDDEDEFESSDVDF